MKIHHLIIFSFLLIGCESVEEKAEKGDADAQFQMGLELLADDSASKALAFKWFRKSAEQGHAEAQYSLGELYYDGTGVAKDEEKALDWFYASAEQDYTEAQRRLYNYWYYQNTKSGTGVLHQAGIITSRYRKDEQVDPDEEHYWLEVLANKGLSDAQRLLAYNYMKGQNVTQDEAKAIELYKKAASSGDAEAIRILNSMGIEF